MHGRSGHHSSIGPSDAMDWPHYQNLQIADQMASASNASILVHMHNSRRRLPGAHTIAALPRCSTKAVRRARPALGQPVSLMSSPCSAGGEHQEGPGGQAKAPCA